MQTSQWSRWMWCVPVLLATSSSAHVLLDEPQRRYDDMKAGPCGRGGGDDGRTGRFIR